jgi:hypothetical protein
MQRLQQRQKLLEVLESLERLAPEFFGPNKRRLTGGTVRLGCCCFHAPIMREESDRRKRNIMLFSVNTTKSTEASLGPNGIAPDPFVISDLTTPLYAADGA